VVLLESYTNVLAFWVLEGVLVVADVSRLGGKNAVITTKFAVLAGEPMRAALAEDDVARNHVLSCMSPSACSPPTVLRECRPYLHSSLLPIAFLAHLWRHWLDLGPDVLNVLRKTGSERVRRRHWQYGGHR
jgi:hypothetical protein